MSRWVVVLAGGVGSRFWPLSTPSVPKQLLPLVGPKAMLVETLNRLRPVAPAGKTLILTNASLRNAVIRTAKVSAKNVLAEPKPAGTAAALAWAAQQIADRDGRDATMISVHADWAVGDDAAFQRALKAAAAAAEQYKCLVTVGVVPSRPDPTLGYIEPGEPLSDGVRKVARFLEKPSRDQAAALIARGALWNSGIFAWRVGDFLDEVQRLSPEIGPALQKHRKSLKKFFAAVQPIAVDHAVLERSSRVLVVPGEFPWDDVGTWGALRRVRPRDARGNTVRGSVHLEHSDGNVVYADGQDVVLFGARDLVVVARRGLTFITTIDMSSELKRLVDALPPRLKKNT